MTQNFSESDFLPYKLAGLLYAPAINISVAEKISSANINGILS